MTFYSHANKTRFHKKGFGLSLVLRVRIFGTRKWPIHHLHISHNAPYLPPPPPPKFCITFVFYFSWVLQPNNFSKQEREAWERDWGKWGIHSAQSGGALGSRG